MTTPKAIDSDVTAAVNRWAGAIGTPDHQAASEALDTLLVSLCRARREYVMLTFLMDWVDHSGLLIRWSAPNPETWMHDLSEIPVMEVHHGETVWNALDRAFEEGATDAAKAGRGDAPTPSRGFRHLAPVLSAQPEIARLVGRCEEEIQGHRMGEPSADPQGVFAELVTAIDAARSKRRPETAGQPHASEDAQ